MIRLGIDGSVDRKSEKEGSQFLSFCLKSSLVDFSVCIYTFRTGFGLEPQLVIAKLMVWLPVFRVKSVGKFLE